MNLWQRFRQWLRGEQTVYYIGGSDVLPPPLRGEAERQANEIREALTSLRETVRENVAAAKAPKVAVTCPFCGATTMPDANGRCEFCGGAIGL